MGTLLVSCICPDVLLGVALCSNICCLYSTCILSLVTSCGDNRRVGKSLPTHHTTITYVYYINTGSRLCELSLQPSSVAPDRPSIRVPSAEHSMHASQQHGCRMLIVTHWRILHFQSSG